MESIDISITVAQEQMSPKLKQLADRINESLKHATKGEVVKVTIDSEGEIYKGRIYSNETGVKVHIDYKDEANPAALMLLQRIIGQTLEVAE